MIVEAPRSVQTDLRLETARVHVLPILEQETPRTGWPRVTAVLLLVLQLVH